MNRVLVATIILSSLTLTAASSDDQWPLFRGLEAGVVADNPALPENWSQNENITWTRHIPGLAWGSPVVWGDHIFVTSAVSSGQDTVPKSGLYGGASAVSTATHRWVVYDVGFTDGQIRWQRELRGGSPPVAKQVKNSYASETPVTDGERVYVYFGNIGLLAAVDLSGNVVWSKDLGVFRTRSGYGSASSPVLHRDRLYIVNDNEDRSFIAAFHKVTGEQIWRVNRDEGTNWSTPFVWTHELGTEIVTTGTDKVRSYGLDGNLVWELKGMSSITVPTPFAKHGLLYISSGFPGDPLRPVYAIRPGAAADISLRPGETSNRYIAWFNAQLGTYNTSALVYGDYYYTLLDRGFLLCHNARTGTQVYGRQRITPNTTGFSSSPWAFNGKLFAMSEEGDTYVIQAGPEFKVLGKNSLDEMALATPAIAQGSLIIRTATKLYRIAKAAPR